ncbi:MAG: phosphoglycerate kinase [Chloroflexi bacterium]|jgi:phosphoglycerate kinase|nr:phosphoglycerate kinase [Chloroflexota bacterium]MBT3862856.1 phosphoglycerate kinase [Chloroflexota bacterium]MBT4143513.1 phosphoglycerate kinase [Chloroflexota bacterium]MBT4943696.1 phosphoglycerate kinase [Chloroflexota bacterium]MBT5252867.1 phosphoglycerate kinase [Chloroflexota bacterium]
MNKRSIQGVDVNGKTVLVRVDFNVPIRNGVISDDSRIRAALPTLNLLGEGGAKVVVSSHFGRPKGQVVEDMRLRIVRERLSELLGAPVLDAGGPNGAQPASVVSGLSSGEFALLENLRFEAGEEANTKDFSKHLASLADLYVNDAFGAAHRAHASTAGVAAHLPAYAGLLMERELEILGRALEGTTGATIAIVGGAKVSDKIQVLRHLSAKVDTILVGGGMVAAFYVAQGRSGGAVDVSDEDKSAAQGLLESGGANVVLPADVITAPEFNENSPATVFECGEVPLDGLILDIGPRSATEYARIISIANTIIWNGPMGVFEWPEFAKGSVAIANAVADNKKATSVIGGGSTAEVVGSLGLVDKITHVSTGGGASLEFLEGKILPGVAALDNA